ncbi:uncharacterized protein LOC125823265 [Solanum verrucosum]|uniref:uncharacterized protein LOC125823265 n=1 Tax=Solanum verrucosum TaxID=315347 RepID=UPI0020D05F89|nr:uncharacterized protein LOC125823265 [Solanum verrucosum]
MSEAEVRLALLMLAQVVTTQSRAMTAQANRDVGTYVNPNVNYTDFRLRDFVKMNPPKFLGSKVGEDPQEFVDEINRPVEAGPIDWEVFKEAFIDRFFPRELRDAKVEEFINLRKGSMSVQEYALKFTQLSKYAPSMVADPRDGMSRFVTGLMGKADKSLNKGISVKIPPIPPRSNQEKGSGSPFPNPTCTKCGHKHHGKWLVGTDGCNGCGKSDHQVKNCPTLSAKGIEAKQASPSDLVPIPLNYGRFYALWSREDKGVSPDEGTSAGNLSEQGWGSPTRLAHRPNVSPIAKLAGFLG